MCLRKPSVATMVPICSLLLAAAAPERPTARKLAVGEVRLYEVKMATVASFRPGLSGRPDDSVEKVTVEVSGTLEVEQARIEDGAGVARLRLTGVGIRAKSEDSSVSPSFLVATKQALAGGVLARLDPDGRVPAVDARSSKDAQGSEILRYLAGVLQAAVPPAEGRAWVTEERDPTGVYEASYRETARGNGGYTFEKKKTGYASAGPVVLVSKCSGTYVGAVDADGWPSHLDGDEEAAAYLSGKGKISSVATRVSLRATGVRPFSVMEVKALALVPMPDEDAAGAPHQTAPEDLRASAAATLGRMDLAGIKRRAEELEATTDKGQPELEIFDKVRAFAILNPERVDELAAVLDKESQDSIFYRAGMLALAQLGTPAAQAAVRNEIVAKLKTDDWQSDVFLLPLLAEPDLPEPANDDLLRAIRGGDPRRDIQVSAHLSLGRLADQLKTVAPARANSIVDEYAAMLPKAKRAEDRSLIVDTLANTSSARLPGILKDELNRPDVDRKAHAYFALRLVRTRRSLDLLVKAATEAPEELVRKAATEALVYHAGLLSPKTQTLLPRLKSESSAEVRQLLMRALSDEVRRSAAARQAVEAVAKDDPDKNVRLYAGSILKAQGAPVLFP